MKDLLIHMDCTVFIDDLSLLECLTIYPQSIFRRHITRNMSNQMKLNTLEAVTKENDVLVLGKEDQKEDQIVEKESQCRDEEKRGFSKEIGERGGKIVEVDIESPVVSSNLQGLKALNFLKSMEGGLDELLMEGKFCMEDYRT